MSDHTNTNVPLAGIYDRAVRFAACIRDGVTTLEKVTARVDTWSEEYYSAADKAELLSIIRMLLNI